MKRTGRILALGLGTLGLLLGALPRDGAGLTKVHTSNFNALHMTVIYVAKENGLFAKEGLDYQISLAKAGGLVTTALIAEKTEVSTSTTVRESVLLRQRGKKTIGFYSLANRMTMDLIVRKNVVQARSLRREMPLGDRYKALKGLKIGISAPGALSDVVVRYYMRRAGLDPDRDAQLIPVGGANLSPSLRTGRIDAYVLSAPGPHWLEKDSHGKIIIKSSAGDVPEFRDYHYLAIVVRQDWLERNEETVRAISRAMNAANRLWRNNVKVAVDAAQKRFPGIPREILALSIDTLKDSLSADGMISSKAVQNAMDLLHGMEPGKFPKSDLDPREGVHYTNKYNPNAS